MQLWAVEIIIYFSWCESIIFKDQRVILFLAITISWFYRTEKNKQKNVHMWAIARHCNNLGWLHSISYISIKNSLSQLCVAVLSIVLHSGRCTTTVISPALWKLIVGEQSKKDGFKCEECHRSRYHCVELFSHYTLSWGRSLLIIIDLI